MGDFMAATAYEVLRRQVELGSKRAAEIPADRPALDALLAILRDVTRNPVNAVMYELMIAARTDEKLRATLQDVLTEYGEKIYDAVRAQPGTESVPDKTLGVLVMTLINTFDGAALVRGVLPQPELDAEQLALLATLIDEKYGA
jgi:hypothetical protein